MAFYGEAGVYIVLFDDSRGVAAVHTDAGSGVAALNRSGTTTNMNKKALEINIYETTPKL